MGVKSLTEFIRSEGTSWSTALAVCTTDLNSGRQKGSAWCKSKSDIAISISLFKLIIFSLFRGRLGTGYFMDPKTGVAVVFGVQIARSMRDVEVYNSGLINLSYGSYLPIRIIFSKLMYSVLYRASAKVVTHSCSHFLAWGREELLDWVQVLPDRWPLTTKFWRVPVDRSAETRHNEQGDGFG